LRYERSARHSAAVLCASEAAAAAVVAAPAPAGGAGVLLVLADAVLTARLARTPRARDGVAAIGVVAVLDVSDEARGGATALRRGWDFLTGEAGDGERWAGRVLRRRAVSDAEDVEASRRGMERLASE
jgi:hypothetical protein